MYVIYYCYQFSSYNVAVLLVVNMVVTVTGVIITTALLSTPRSRQYNTPHDIQQARPCDQATLFEICLLEALDIADQNRQPPL